MFENSLKLKKESGILRSEFLWLRNGPQSCCFKLQGSVKCGKFLYKLNICWFLDDYAS